MLAAFLHLAPLHLDDWLLVAGGAVLLAFLSYGAAANRVVAPPRS